MSELKNGDRVYATNNCPFNYNFEYFYIGKSVGGKHVVQSRSGSPSVVFHVEKVPEKKLVPFDFDTFPKGEVWAREKSITHRSTVHYIDDEYVSFGGSNFLYLQFMNDCEISLDGGETWKPAGIEQ